MVSGIGSTSAVVRQQFYGLQAVIEFYGTAAF